MWTGIPFSFSFFQHIQRLYSFLFCIDSRQTIVYLFQMMAKARGLCITVHGAIKTIRESFAIQQWSWSTVSWRFDCVKVCRRFFVLLLEDGPVSHQILPHLSWTAHAPRCKTMIFVRTKFNVKLAYLVLLTTEYLPCWKFVAIGLQFRFVDQCLSTATRTILFFAICFWYGVDTSVPSFALLMFLSWHRGVFWRFV